MQTILFVHGTGVRAGSYEETLAEIRRQVAGWTGVRVEGCFWGEELGTSLVEGASVPTFDATRAVGETTGTSDPEEDAWRMLLIDPTFELRLLAIAGGSSAEALPIGGGTGDELDQAFRAFLQAPRENLTEELRKALARAGLDATFDQARLALDPDQSEACREAIQSAARPFGDHRRALARSLVARALILRDGQDPDLPLDRDAIDQAVARIVDELGGDDRSADPKRRSLGEHSRAIVGSVLSSIGTFGAARYRGKITRALALVIGDILLYQAKGRKIRAAIAKAIRAQGPGVVLVAHSLGGIAALDLLVKHPSLYRRLDLFVTVGSQGTFLYELGALQSLEPGEALPPRFPTWLNFYDLSDFLSYVGQHPRLFGTAIRDVQVFSRKPFPASHGAYFADPAVWARIRERLESQGGPR